MTRGLPVWGCHSNPGPFSYEYEAIVVASNSLSDLESLRE